MDEIGGYAVMFLPHWRRDQMDFETLRDEKAIRICIA